MDIERHTAQRGNVGLLTLDTLLKSIGPCGLFQWLFSVQAMLPMVPATWGLLFMAFGNYNPGWSCQDGFNISHVETSDSLASSQGNHSLSTRRQDASVCDTMRTCQNLTFSDRASTIVTEWALICEDSWVTSIIISVQMVGVMLGSIAGGHIGDKLGRKFSIHGSVALLAVTNFIAVFSVSWQMYAVLRFLIGFCCGGILSSDYVYVSEYISAKWRAVLGAFPFWNVYTFSFALCVVSLKDWRYIHFASSCISFVAFLPVFWLPESLRILTVHGKLDRAIKAVHRVAKLNKKPIPDTSIINVIAETKKDNLKTRSNYTYKDLWHKNIRKSTIVMGMAWIILSYGYFMIAFGLKALSGDFFANLLIHSVIPVPVRLIAVTVAAKVGRKVSSASFVLISGVCSLSVVGIQLLLPEDDRGIPTVVMAFGSAMTLEAAWGVIAVLVVELFPTPVRNLAYGYCNALARFGAITAPYMLQKERLPIFGAFLLFGILQLICFAGLLTITETKQRPLRDNFLATEITKEKQKINPDCEN